MAMALQLLVMDPMTIFMHIHPATLVGMILLAAAVAACLLYQIHLRREGGRRGRTISSLDHLPWVGLDDSDNDKASWVRWFWGFLFPKTRARIWNMINYEKALKVAYDTVRPSV